MVGILLGVLLELLLGILLGVLLGVLLELLLGILLGLLLRLLLGKLLRLLIGELLGPALGAAVYFDFFNVPFMSKTPLFLSLLSIFPSFLFIVTSSVVVPGTVVPGTVVPFFPPFPVAFPDFFPDFLPDFPPDVGSTVLGASVDFVNMPFMSKTPLFPSFLFIVTSSVVVPGTVVPFFPPFPVAF